MSLRPPNGVSLVPGPHPSRGGNAYSQEIRDQVIWRYKNNLPLSTPELNAMRHDKVFPCLGTCNNIITRYVEEGDACARRPTGNMFAEREILGRPLERLALFWVVHPKATYAEARAHLYNLDPTVDPYSDSQVHRAKVLLDLRRKRASTTAAKAYTLRNLTWRHSYWNAPPPAGMLGVSPDDIIDIDETAFKLESSDRKYGYAVRELRCSDTGAYGAGKKINFLLAINGAREGIGMRWFDCWEGGGTTIHRFGDFIEMVLEDLRERHPGHSFVFTMDNLNTHHNAYIQTMIIADGHRIVYRAPYWPVDGAIEYVFNTIHSRLMEYFNRLQDLDDLRNRVILIVGQMENFHSYFINVGFRDE
jgi:transposase